MLTRHLRLPNVIICLAVPALITLLIIFSGDGAALRSALGGLFGAVWQLTSPVITPIFWFFWTLILWILPFGAAIAVGAAVPESARAYGREPDVQIGILSGVATLVLIWMLPVSAYWSFVALVFALCLIIDEPESNKSNFGIIIVLASMMGLLVVMIDHSDAAHEHAAGIRYTQNMSADELAAMDAAHDVLMDEGIPVWRKNAREIQASDLGNSPLTRRSPSGPITYTCVASQNAVTITAERVGVGSEPEKAEVSKILRPALERTCLKNLGLLPK